MQKGLSTVSHELEWTNRTLEQAWDEVLASRAEGIILSSSFGSISTSATRKLLKSPVPTISLYGPDISSIPLLAPDLRAAFRELTSHLIQSGRRNLVFLKSSYLQESETRTNWKGAERRAGFLDAVRENEVEETCSVVELEREVLETTVEHHLGIQGLAEILTRSGGQPPDAVICINDNFALGVISEAVRLKIDVPGQMAVTGCDGEDWTGFGALPITTIVQPSEALARSASELLLAMLEGKSPAAARTFLPCEIVWRASCPKN
jgi:DNA-binding LacI/PurR family transcriptional regulator